MSRVGTGGSGRFVNWGDVAEITGTALTVHVAAKNSGAGGAAMFIATRYGTSNKQWAIKSQGGPPGVIRLQIGDNGGSGEETVDCATGLTSGAWMFIGLRKSGTGANALRGYRNGVQDGSGTSNFTIGDITHGYSILSQSDDNTSHRYAGSVAELAVWNVALNDSELLALGRGVRANLIRQGNLRFYSPVWGVRSPEPTSGGVRAGGTLFGSTDNPTDHPSRCSNPMVV